MDQTLLGAGREPDDNQHEPHEFDLREVVGLLRRHWLTLVGAAVLGLGWGAVQFLNTPETYRASSRIHIQRLVPSPLGGQSLWMESIWNPEFYPTQYEILEGQGLAKKVVDLLELWRDSHFESTVARVSHSNEEGNTAVDDERMKSALAASIRGNLQVRPIKGTQLVDMVYTSSDPEVAAKLANGYARAFIQQGKSDRREAADQFTERITAEIENLERAINEDEGRLFELLDDADMVDTPSNSEATDARLATLGEQLADAQQRLAAAQAEYNSRRNQPQEVVAELADPEAVSAARSRLDELESDYESRSSRYQESAPVMVELRRNIAEERRRYQSKVEAIADRAIKEAEASYQRALQEERSLEARSRSLRRELRESQVEVADATNLRERILAQRETLNQLRTNQQRARVSSGGSDSAVRIVDEAVAPRTPISPNLRADLTKGTLLGLLLGCILVTLVELLDRTIKTPDELEKRLRLPVLAVIPDVAAKRGYGAYGYGYGYGVGRSSKRRRSEARADDLEIDLIPNRRPRLAVSEAYRGLRTGLLMSSAEELKTIAVTSSFASEGKTATAANLATVLAQLGKKTLLIDGDLRKARIHELLKVSNRNGLVNFLVGARSIDKVVLPTEIDDLFAAPAGPTPPNPSELLASARMHHFLDEARRAFDFVVIDTPPVLVVTDATILGSMVDGMIMTTRAGRVTRDDLRACKNRLELGGVRILGTVLNCYRPAAGRRKQSYSAYHYETYGLPEGAAATPASSRGEVA